MEAQHQISTRRLVDSDREQQVLEELIESSKPRMAVRRGLHYLLATPFRYPPLRHGSRFATRYERGLWYGSETIRTMFAEVSYYRLLFLEGTAADLGVVATQLTVFPVPVATGRGIDLTLPPFAAYVSELASKTTYGAAQSLGRAMREDGVEAFRYVSARDAAGGVNAAVLSDRAFGTLKPRKLETWHCVATRERVEMTRRDYFARASFAFERSSFLVDGRLPQPA